MRAAFHEEPIDVGSCFGIEGSITSVGGLSMLQGNRTWTLVLVFVAAVRTLTTYQQIL